LAALPETYAARGTAVLVATGRLTEDDDVRVRGTAQFLLLALQPLKDAKATRHAWTPPKEDEPDGNHDPTDDGTVPPWVICSALRLYHQSVRQALHDDPKHADLPKKIAGVPLNQEDLLGTLLTFSITVFEVLERFGIRWSRDEQDAYLHTWDVVGCYLGVGSEPVVRDFVPPNGWPGIRPASVPATVELLQQIRTRQWPTVQQSDKLTSSTRSGGGSACARGGS
jgi:hypothetical protein